MASVKHLRVACAIIEQGGLVLAAQRSESMNLPLKWEFPGGKIDGRESAEECLVREVMEELNLQVAIHKALPATVHHYSDFSITLYPFVCSIIAGNITLSEHIAVTWLPPADLYSLDWAEADLPIISCYRERFMAG